MINGAVGLPQKHYYPAWQEKILAKGVDIRELIN